MMCTQTEGKKYGMRIKIQVREKGRALGRREVGETK